MKVSDYIVDYLISCGVTDVFGLPGGVVLDFLYALNKRKNEIEPHLSFHEQSAAFAACGYAQTTGRLGVAYSTKGPGITNMLTAVADAYFDSVPVLFITAHDDKKKPSGMRVFSNQELDIIPLVKGITKYVARVDELSNVRDEVVKACTLAVKDRKGPVVLDILSTLWKQDIDCRIDKAAKAVKTIAQALSQSRRPILLIGDGIRKPNVVPAIKAFAEDKCIPVLSSRFAQDIMPDTDMYFGYIGSHATRYSNFILSKADLIVSLGNRMAFPIESDSFRPIVERTQLIRIDIDDREFSRVIPNCQDFAVDVYTISDMLASINCHYKEEDTWLNVCHELKTALWNEDTNFPINFIAKILNNLPATSVIVSDVGNNELWISRAYTYAKATNRMLYSKSFGTLGCAIPKAIGTFYSSKRPVICFLGDQGLQFNIQELEYVASHQLPIMIIVLNNCASGMIRDAEVKRFEGVLLHTTLTSGYSVPNIQKVAMAYGIDYHFLDESDSLDCIRKFGEESRPLIFEIKIAEEISLSPMLPKGSPCQDMQPQIDRKLYEHLNKL